MPNNKLDSEAQKIKNMKGKFNSVVAIIFWFDSANNFPQPYSEEGACYPHSEFPFHTNQNNRNQIKRKQIQKDKLREKAQFSGCIDTQTNLKLEKLAFRSVELEFHVVVTAISLSMFYKENFATEEHAKQNKDNEFRRLKEQERRTQE